MTTGKPGKTSQVNSTIGRLAQGGCVLYAVVCVPLAWFVCMCVCVCVCLLVVKCFVVQKRHENI